MSDNNITTNNNNNLKEFANTLASQGQNNMNLWVEEQHGKNFATRFRCKKVLCSIKSSYQNIDVVETAGQGRLLLNDGIVMISEKDEAVYHEMIAHVPLFTHPKPCSVLIIGGGDGGSAKEVLRHSNVAGIVNVEIDKMVVEVSKKYFPRLAGAFKDPRVELLFEDGAEFVKRSTKKYDVVLVDSTDPLGPACSLFTPEFYKNVFRILTKDGVLVVQAESPLFAREQKAQKFILQSLKSAFPIVSLYHYSNVVYPGGLWSFAWASKKYHPVKDFQKSQTEQCIKDWGLHYYNADIHLSAFAQAEYIKRNLNSLLTP